MIDSTFKNGDPKRRHLKGLEEFTGQRKSEKDKHDVGAPEREEENNNSSTRRSSTENDDKSPEDYADSRNESRRIIRTLSKDGKSGLAAPPEVYVCLLEDGI